MAEKKLISAAEIDNVDARIQRVSKEICTKEHETQADVSDFFKEIAGIDYFSAVGWASVNLEGDAPTAYAVGLAHGIILGAERAIYPLVHFDAEAGRLQSHAIDAEVAENVSNIEARLDK